MNVPVLMPFRSYGLVLSVVALLAVLLPGRTWYACSVDGDRHETCCCAAVETASLCSGASACEETELAAQHEDGCACCEIAEEPGLQQDLPPRSELSQAVGLAFAVLPVLPDLALPATIGEDFLPVQAQGPPRVRRLYIQYGILLI